MRRLHTGFGTLLAGGILLILTWALWPVIGPPLYDGLGLPPESYRYLHPPSGYKGSTKLPYSAKGSSPVSGGTTGVLILPTSEQPPQAQLVLEDRAIHVPASVKRVDLSIHPVAPPALPQDGILDGNVYRFAIVANNGARVDLVPGKTSVVLRGTGARGAPVIENYVNGRWVRETTGRYLGAAIFVARVNALGDFALVFPGKAAGGSSGTSFLPFLIVGGLIIVLIAIALLLVRLNRQRTTLEA